MLIVLVVLAVALSLVAEFLYGHFQDGRQRWVRPALQQHRALIALAGGVKFKPIRVSERQMNGTFKVSSDRAC
ncbi:hypothetical protein ASC90_04055 [Rhizobium sp. Root1220]|nr:hypothetical protein ASC90_04055 [Rhizobium sp. Root1220]